MKTYYYFLAFVFAAASLNAQTKEFPFGAAHAVNVPVHILPFSSARAAGDTIMYMPLPVTYVNASDSANFSVTTQDLDLLPVNTAGADPDFGIYFSANSNLNNIGSPTMDNFYHPWETPAPAGNDTSFFWQATSWFNPIGHADNWLNFGPITIPGTGANLIWYDRTAPAWRDGYRVLVSAAPSAVLTHTDFVDPPIFTKADSYPSATITTDTTWVMHQVNIPSIYNGQTVSIAFNHNANNMDVLYLDEITLKEGYVGIDENQFVNGVQLFQNYPNPFNSVSFIYYDLKDKSTIHLYVYDVTGNIVAALNEGIQTSGKHSIHFCSSGLSAGVYYYTLSVDSNCTLSKKMIIVK